MSRLAKKPINVPDQVVVDIDLREIKVKGPKGEINFFKKSYIDFEKINDSIKISTKRKGPKSRALVGLYVSLFKNACQGVTQGFEKKLEFEGVGFRANSEGPRKITFSLGFSHPVIFEAPEEIELKVEKNVITVSGINKDLVGRVAAKIRSIKKPEPYKGKGIKYQDEIIRRKPGKAAATAQGGSE